jgi:hypothetical protein
MAVQDNPKYSEWEKAEDERDRRKRYYEAAKNLPEKHPLRRHCKRKFDEAQAAYDAIVSELH